MRVNFRTTYPKLLLLLILSVLVLLILLLSKNAQIGVANKNLRWKLIESKRAAFSFKYPTSWPINIDSDEKLNQSRFFYKENEPFSKYDVEAIEFAEECKTDCALASYGYINVWKENGINTLDDYLQKYAKESRVFSKGGWRPVPRPNIKYSTIGGEVAITLNPQDTSISLNSPEFESDYCVVKNGLIYRFQRSHSTLFEKDKELNTGIFNEILASVKFGT